MIEKVSDDTLDIIGFTLAHELATTEGYLPYGVGDEFGYTGSYTYKSYVVRTEHTYQDDGTSLWVWNDTINSRVGFILILDLRYMILRIFNSISGRVLIDQ